MRDFLRQRTISRSQVANTVSAYGTVRATNQIYVRAKTRRRKHKIHNISHLSFPRKVREAQILLPDIVAFCIFYEHISQRYSRRPLRLYIRQKYPDPRMSRDEHLKHDLVVHRMRSCRATRAKIGPILHQHACTKRIARFFFFFLSTYMCNHVCNKEIDDLFHVRSPPTQSNNDGNQVFLICIRIIKSSINVRYVCTYAGERQNHSPILIPYRNMNLKPDASRGSDAAFIFVLYINVCVQAIGCYWLRNVICARGHEGGGKASAVPKRSSRRRHELIYIISTTRSYVTPRRTISLTAYEVRQEKTAREKDISKSGYIDCTTSTCTRMNRYIRV
uniref:Uncharacterized protein n=1 Tax=Trichogramma kaykai TaxID=54128 RepID=A0ABD2XPL0_9HYME